MIVKLRTDELDYKEQLQLAYYVQDILIAYQRVWDQWQSVRALLMDLSRPISGLIEVADPEFGAFGDDVVAAAVRYWASEIDERVKREIGR